MSQIRHSDFLKSEEYRAAYLNDMEFAEMARILKQLARDRDQDSAPVIDELARHGLDAALEALAGATGDDVSGAYYRRREIWRVSEAGTAGN